MLSTEASSKWLVGAVAQAAPDIRGLACAQSKFEYALSTFVPSSHLCLAVLSCSFKEHSSFACRTAVRATSRVLSTDQQTGADSASVAAVAQSKSLRVGSLLHFPATALVCGTQAGGKLFARILFFHQSPVCCPLQVSLFSEAPGKLS